jgi:hypothetical protein
MSSTSTFPLEDKLMFLSAVLAAFASFAMGQNFGNAAFYALALGAASKALLSFGNGINAEDTLLVLTSFFAVLSVSVLNNPQYAIYSLLLGAVAKAIPSLAANPTNVEDWILLSVPVVTAVAGLPQFANSTALQEIGLLFGFLGKSLSGVSSGAVSTVAPVVTG